MDINVVINQMLVLLLLMGVGYVIVKGGIGDYSMQEVLTKLILNATAPALMLSSVSGGQAKGTLKEVMIVFTVSLIMYIILPFLGMFLSFILKVRPEEKNLYVFMTTFSNVGFMGFPVIRSIFGEQGIFYAAIMNMVFNILSYSYGMALMSGKPIPKRVREYMNIPVVTALLTVVLYLLKVPFHPALNQAIRTLGDATTPLAMIVLGMSLTRIPIRTLFQDPRLVPFTFIKQVILPLVAFYILKPVIVDPLILGVTVISSAMPVATNCVLFATKYGNNVETATRSVFVTTMASLITIPLLTWFMQR